MSDHDALLATILAHPDDDLPRLVFADWLEESGHPAHVARAQFIRLQIEAAKLDTGSADALNLLREADGHRASFRDEADAAIAGPVLFRPSDLSRRRGFVEELAGTPDALLRHAGQIVGVAPVRAVRLAGVYHIDNFLSNAAWLSQIRTVRVHNLPLGQAVVNILRCKSLTSLTRLQAIGCELNNVCVLRFISLFTESVFAGTLRELDVSSNFGITDAGASALAAARGLDQLATLRLWNCDITPAGAALLRSRFGDRVVL